MLGKQITLFRLFGFEVKIDLSWFILAALIIWSLAETFLPRLFANLPRSTYWRMAVGGAVGVFFSIVFHELCHSLVARRFGLAMKGITLFVFGGVAEMEDEPPSARAEFLMAVAGPLSSIGLGVLCYVVYMVGKGSGWPVTVHGVFGALAQINLYLAVFNLVPAFPLDGGRVLRSILWSWKANLRWATRVSSTIGSVFGIALIVLGVFFALQGAVIAGIWFFVIGMFLRSAAQMSYRQLIMRKALEGEQVRTFMKTNPISVPSSTSVERFVEDYVYRHHFKMFPVLENDTLVGCVTTRRVKEIPREQWSRRTVGEIVGGCSKENTVSPDVDAIKALSIMSKTGNSRLMVVEDGRLLGIIALKDLLEFLSVKLDLEGYGE